jgi:hypothetical protein
MQNMVMPPVYCQSVKWLLPQPGFLSEGIQVHVFQPAEQFSLSLSGPIIHCTAHMTANGITNISAQSEVTAGEESTQNSWWKLSTAHKHHTRKLLQHHCITYYFYTNLQQTDWIMHTKILLQLNMTSNPQRFKLPIPAKVHSVENILHMQCLLVLYPNQVVHTVSSHGKLY